MFNQQNDVASAFVGEATAPLLDRNLNTEQAALNASELSAKFTDSTEEVNSEQQNPEMTAPDERSFWKKMSASAKKLGEETAVMGIKSWLAMTDSKTALQHKAILGGALAYFVLPTDMVPDFLAGVGFTDDTAAMMIAVNSVGSAVTETHEQQAREKWANF